MHKIIEKFEESSIYILIFAICIAITLSLVGLLKEIVFATLNIFQLEMQSYFNIFGMALLALVGFELLETIHAYHDDHKIRLNVVLAAAAIAVARKVIILDISEIDGIKVIALAFLLASLLGGIYISEKKTK